MDRKRVVGMLALMLAVFAGAGVAGEKRTIRFSDGTVVTGTMLSNVKGRPHFVISIPAGTTVKLALARVASETSDGRVSTLTMKDKDIWKGVLIQKTKTHIVIRTTALGVRRFAWADTRPKKADIPKLKKDREKAMVKVKAQEEQLALAKKLLAAAKEKLAAIEKRLADAMGIREAGKNF